MYKWYNPESVPEKAMQITIWDHEIQKVQTTRRPNLVIVNKEKKERKKRKKRACRILDFAVPAGYREKLKESEKRDKYLDLVRET